MEIKKLYKKNYPISLNQIEKLPDFLYYRGADIDKTNKLVSFVGARKYSQYGKNVTEKIIEGLKGYPITIVSGLAIGIDAISHKAALDNGLKTIAILGSGLEDDVIYPKMNFSLAMDILKNGGTLISEEIPNTKPSKYTFPKRNRIIAGISELVIATECAKKSGTRITTALATQLNTNVGAVPHSIFSESGSGTNELLSEGAYVIKSSEDVLEILGLEKNTKQVNLEILTDNEKNILNLLTEGKTRSQLLKDSKLPLSTLQVTLATLEIKKLIKEIMGKVEKI